MEHVPVTSTSIASIGYHAESLTLEVEFTNGGLYQYLGVPPKTYEEFLTAESKGTFYNARVKNDYPYRKVN